MTGVQTCALPICVISEHKSIVRMKLEPRRWYQVGIEIVGEQMRVTLDGAGKVTGMKPFLEGFLENDKGDPPMWGRPVDVLVMRDGALLMSDDYNGVIYRISYKK